MTEARHRIAVEATRAVACPLYGPHAYQRDTHQKCFGFGKGQEYPSGAKAREAAEAYAQTLLERASSVSLIHWNGGNGQCVCLKDDSEQRFSTKWDGTVPD